jgi:hypothetical protein
VISRPIFLVPKPFNIIQADDTEWTNEERLAHTPPGFPNTLTGVYFYFDTCTADDIEAKPSAIDTHFCVLRKLGSATNSFYDRVRKAHWTDKGTRLRFTHRWIDIIPIHYDFGFVTLALEDFLLQRLRSTVDIRRVAAHLRTSQATIYGLG